MKKRKREKLDKKKAARREIPDVLIINLENKEPSGQLNKRATEMYQDEIKHSEIWDEMIERHGIDKALELLKGFKVIVQ